jgi:cation diffusion facilitator CzcD-associated flavoprotein CzcO
VSALASNRVAANDPSQHVPQGTSLKKGKSTMVSPSEDKYCIIGAGPAGLTTARALKELNIDFDIIEREDDVGGQWYYGKPNSSIYRSLHMISSKKFAAFVDYPMPDHYPTYINQPQAWEYLRSYARHFGIYDHIEFSRSVEHVERPDGPSHWNVRLDGNEWRRYRGVIIANGHLWSPRYPQYPGTFHGQTLHSSQYKTPDILRGKRVLVVGAGNSGCDIAVESSQNASKTFHSTRRGYHYWPKYLLGQPADVIYELALKSRVPWSFRRAFGRLLLLINSAGNPRKYGLPRPDHKLFDEHFIINSTLLYHLGQGDIAAKPDIQELAGNEVIFKDGSREPIDVIIWGTGFDQADYPFIEQGHMNWAQFGPEFYLNIFHPTCNDLFIVGLFQTSTGDWPIMDYQARLLSRYLHALDHDEKRARWFDQLKAAGSPDMSGGLRYLKTDRHGIEVEHFTYRKFMKKLTAKLKVNQAALAGAAKPPSTRPVRVESALPAPRTAPISAQPSPTELAAAPLPASAKAKNSQPATR